MEEMTNYLMTVSRRVCWVWTPPFLKHSLSCLPEPRQLLLLFHPALAFLCKCPLLTLPLLPSHFLSELSVAPRPTLSSLSMTISTCSTASIAVCILMLSILLSGVLTFHLSSRVIYAIKSPFTSHRNLKLKTSSTQAMSLHLSWCTPPPVLLFSVNDPPSFTPSFTYALEPEIREWWMTPMSFEWVYSRRVIFAVAQHLLNNSHVTIPTSQLRIQTLKFSCSPAGYMWHRFALSPASK